MQQAQRGRDLLVAPLPSCQWRTVPVRKGPFRTQSTCKHWGFEENEAVVHGLVSRVSDVCVDVHKF